MAAGERAGGGPPSAASERKRSVSGAARRQPIQLVTLLGALISVGLLSLVLQAQWFGRDRVARLESLGKKYVVARNSEYASVLGGKPEAIDSHLRVGRERRIVDADHLNLLRDVCLSHGRTHVIPWTYGAGGREDANASMLLAEDDGPRLVEFLSQCGEVDLFYADRDMGLGYCEDYAVYAKYLRARMLPSWVLSKTFVDETTRRSFTYHELCPATPMVFFNHYWDDYPFSFAWPASKPVFLMPNIEMYELTALHYWSVDLVLCKTVMCYERVTKWFKQEGNPRQAAVVYTRHTSTDYVSVVRMNDPGAGKVEAKNFSDPVRFLHTAGKSLHKGTPQVIECWLARPDLPQLDLYVHEEVFREKYAPRYLKYLKESKNIKVHVGELSPDEFAQLVVETSFFLCPSIQEGYGHYLNQARAARGLVITTDLPPMNELITATTGVLIPASPRVQAYQMMGGGFQSPHGLKGVGGMVANFFPKGVCSAVDAVLTQLTPAQREAKAKRAQVEYFRDLDAFADTMEAMRRLIQRHQAQLGLVERRRAILNN